MKCPETGLQCDNSICTGMCIKQNRDKTPGFSQAQDEYFAREKARSRPAGESGELYLHHKDGSQTRFSDAAAQTISDVMAAFETGEPRPCCGDFTNCKRMCIPRAEYWKTRSEAGNALAMKEVQDSQKRITQFQFCIDRVAEALGNVCCGGVDSSPEDQLADPHSTTRVLCDAIRALQMTRQQWYGDANGTFQQVPVMIIDKSAPILKQMNAVQCPRCYTVVAESCGPNCAWDWAETGEAELKRLRTEADKKDFIESLKNRGGL